MVPRREAGADTRLARAGSGQVFLNLLSGSGAIRRVEDGKTNVQVGAFEDWVCRREVVGEGGGAGLRIAVKPATADHQTGSRKLRARYERGVCKVLRLGQADEKKAECGRLAHDGQVRERCGLETGGDREQGRAGLARRC